MSWYMGACNKSAKGVSYQEEYANQAQQEEREAKKEIFVNKENDNIVVIDESTIYEIDAECMKSLSCGSRSDRI